MLLNTLSFLTLVLLSSSQARINKLANEQVGELAAVIVTINAGPTYDPLFSAVPQKAPEGSRVDVYDISPDLVPQIVAFLDTPSRLETREAREANPLLLQLVTSILSLEKESIVFNWECCGHWTHDFGTYHFEKGTIKDIRSLIDRGYLLMFSDFSVKALIADWDPSLLGPNSLIHFGEFAGSFELAFSPDELKESVSAQLQKLGDLSPEGKTVVRAMSSTIAFTVDQRIATSEEAKTHYQLKVLTIATRLGQDTTFPDANGHILSLGDKKGVAGHVLITYPSGGKLLLSCGHWVELSHIHVTEASLLNASSKYYGDAYTDLISQQLKAATSVEEKESLLQSFSKLFVQESSPGQYSRQEKKDL